ncbi:MAG TPA: Ig-like domain-containing protein [Candidatus Acidoferrum sp.]|jgi:hypothetical protein
MVFGHNTNVKLGVVTFHVQTEDRGESHALIDTTVYYQGRVLHRRTNNYFDLLPMNEDRQQALKLRVDEQHHTVLEEMHSGVLQLAIPQPTVPLPPAVASPAGNSMEILIESPTAPRMLNIELVNAKSWLAGKRATLQISVKEENGNPVAGAKIDVHIEGSAQQQPYRSESGTDGQAQIEFEMPKITSTEAAMVILAEESRGHGQLRFALRAKPKVPSL